MRMLLDRTAIRLGALLILSALALCTTGCVHLAAKAIATSPNAGKWIDTRRAPDKPALRKRGVSDAFRVEIDEPRASLAVWIVDPPARAKQSKPRGTILFLHGIFARKEMMLETAKSYAAVGYRGVLVDSRGHGESTGDYLGYGALEADDYARVIDELERRGLLAGKLGVYGCSYGAGVAVQFGARDPRVAAVVALSPFSTMREIVHDRARSMGLRIVMSARTIDAAIADACERSGICAEDADGVAALAARNVPLLIIHGMRDRTIPFSHAERLAAAGGANVRLVPVAHATHENWTAEGLRQLWPESSGWFELWLTPEY